MAQSYRLSRETKGNVGAGDRLTFDTSRNKFYRVLRVVPYNNGITFTIQDEQTGQVIYCYPSSKLYGAFVFCDEAIHEGEGI